jgi:hypothetical protein
MSLVLKMFFLAYRYLLDLESSHYFARKYKNLSSSLKPLMNPNVSDKATPSLSELWFQSLLLSRAVFKTLKHSGGMRYVDVVHIPCCVSHVEFPALQITKAEFFSWWNPHQIMKMFIICDL